MPGAGTKLEKPDVFFSAEQASSGDVLLIPAEKVVAVQDTAKALLGRPFDDDLRLDDGGENCIAPSWLHWRCLPLTLSTNCLHAPCHFCRRKSSPLTIWWRLSMWRIDWPRCSDKLPVLGHGSLIGDVWTKMEIRSGLLRGEIFTCPKYRESKLFGCSPATQSSPWRR